ncbi:MAG TPA: LuxR C-terminal-related transcriptional regulator [Devosia sp.]|nr:LuxR C-terminal-related transcriptional regulator [Devosia sp.]
MRISAVTSASRAYFERLANQIRALPEQDRQMLLKILERSPTEDLGLAPDEIRGARFGVARLTDRELTVLRYVLAGLQNKAIADVLAISHRTVEVYRARAQEKLLARNTRHMCSLAMAIGVKAAPRTHCC